MTALPSFLEGSGAGEGKKRAKTSQAPKEEDLLTELCVALANTSIEQDRELREHTGSLNRVILMPISGAPTGFLAEGVNEGEAFQQEVKENPGKDLGSPHIRIALKTLHSLIQEILIFKMRVPEKQSNTWRKKGIRRKKDMEIEEDESKFIRVEFCLENKNIQAALARLLVELGGIQKTGPPPPKKNIRLVKSLLAKMKR